MNYFDFLKKTFLFCDLVESELCAIQSKIGEIKPTSFGKNDIIKKQSEKEAKLGFIVSGQADIFSKREGTPVLLNTLKSTDAFGVVNIYSDFPHFPTEIVAKTKTEVLFFTKQQIDTILAFSPKASMNYIKFLSGRVAFLNQKISEVSKGSATEKLIHYLRNHFTENLPFSINHKSVSLQLGIGRASLYRAIDELKENGTIAYDGKQYTLLNSNCRGIQNEKNN